MAAISSLHIRLSEIGKKMRHTKRMYVMVAVAVVVLVCGGVWGMQTVANRQAAEQERRESATKVQGMEHELKDAQAKQIQPGTNSDQAAPTAEPANQPAPQANTRKYATSSDPRSTAYSTTPPAPNPSSFEINITRNGQVAAGTLISYNATKGEKTYYGGDLLLSTYSVTISKVGLPGVSRPTVVVSSPDGQEIGMPSKPWYDRSPVFIAMDSSKYKSSGTSFEMLVDLAGAPVGTYQMPIWSGRTAQTADGWRYCVFLTVHVVD